MSNAAYGKRLARATFGRRYTYEVIKQYIKEISTRLEKNLISAKILPIILIKLNYGEEMKLLTENHEIRQGDDELISMLFEIDNTGNRDFEPLDLTGSTVKLQVKRKKTEAAPVFEVDGVISQTETNRADFQLLSSQTMEKGNFVFAVLQTLGDGKVHTRAVGNFLIKDRFEN